MAFFTVKYKINNSDKIEIIESNTIQEAKGLFWEYFDKVERIKPDCNSVSQIDIKPIISREYIDNLTPKELSEIQSHKDPGFLFS